MGLVPTLTAEQRIAAIEKASDARRAGAATRGPQERRHHLRRGPRTRSDHDDVLANTKLHYVLESLPKVGRIKATGIMDEVGIAERRGLRGLGERQRTELLSLPS